MPGWTEWFVIFLIALVFLGPEELPKLARRMSQILNEIRGVFQPLSRDSNVGPKDNAGLKDSAGPKDNGEDQP